MLSLLRKLKGFWPHAILFGLVLVFVIVGVQTTSLQSSTESLTITQDAVKRALVECYSIEGAYPPDISYLEKNYGLQLDNAKYYVYYDAYAENIMPDVAVVEK